MENKKEIRRTFSTTFKKEKVSLLNQGKTTVSELSKIYDVSPTAIYKWIKKYTGTSKTERVVIEKISEEKKNIELMKRIRDLEQALGKKQLELDYYKEVVEIINDQEGVDIEKKSKQRRCQS